MKTIMQINEIESRQKGSWIEKSSWNAANVLYVIDIIWVDFMKE